MAVIYKVMMMKRKKNNMWKKIFCTNICLLFCLVKN